jgi:hypothetical protein
MVKYTVQTIDRNIFYCSWKSSLNALRLSSESTNIRGNVWEIRIKQRFPPGLALGLWKPRSCL